MFRLMRFVWAIAILVAASAAMGTAFSQKERVPRKVDTHALAEDEVKQLLLLMDTDKNGKISKQEWMKFMEEEFDRLDKDKKGELDVKEIAQSKVRSTRSANMGK
jgi:CRISPR/Cas system-associated endonuclease Cas3-HD